MSIKQKIINIMNALTISKREELCRNLNMNFDEASELFSDETLESMQMAKVNGGVVLTALTVTWIASITATVVAGIITNYVIKWIDGTSTTAGDAHLFTGDGKTEVIIDNKFRFVNFYQTTSGDTVNVHFQYVRPPASVPTPTRSIPYL